jgi:lysophospholipase L1-like esterase
VRRLARIALVIAAIIVAIALGEVALRAIDYHYSPVKIGDGIAGDFREEHAFHDRHLVYDPDLIWRPLSGQFSPFNPQGFRGLPVVMPKPAGTFRIFALGDSNTFGWDVDDGVNWPAQLHTMLKDQGAEVINAGVWGYTSFQGLARFKELIAFNPDLIMVSFGGNDAHQVRVPDDRYVRGHDRIDRLTRATRKLRVAQLAVAGWDLAGVAAAGSGSLVPRVSLDDYRRNLREMIALGRSRGIIVVLLTRPFIGESDDPKSWKTYAPQYNAATLAIAAEEHVPAIDVFAAFHNREKLFDDESHFGVEGHHEAALMLHDALLPLIAAPSRP